MLERLPPEVLSLIIQRINDKAHLKALSQVSRFLYYHTVPELYRSVTIRAIDEHDLATFGLSVFAQSAKQLIHVKHLQITAPFHNRLRSRCPYEQHDEDDDYAIYEDNYDPLTVESDDGTLDDLSNDQDSNESEDTLKTNEINIATEHSIIGDQLNHQTEGTPVNNGEYDESQNSEPGSNNENADIWRDGSPHASFLRDLESQISPLLRSITDGGLRSFSWNVGTCIPLSVANYLSNKQTQITSLAIATDVTCLSRHSSESIRHLHGFSQLRCISWTASSYAEVETLGTILRCSAAHLQEIKIDAGYPSSSCLWSGAENPFGIEPGSRSTLFPVLQRLTLLGISLGDSIEDFVFAFRLPQLQYLKLRDCWGTNRLLDFLATSLPAAHLTSFELSFRDHFVDQYDVAPLIKFLLSFQGLEDLFILYPRQWTLGPEYWGSVSHHCSTLRRVVHHQFARDIRSDDNAINGLIGVLGELKTIHYLGSCFHPKELSCQLTHVQPRPEITILHIRPNGWAPWESTRHDENPRRDSEFSEALPMVKEFAQWAFGPEGLPNLAILAYGDFSFQGRQPNIMLCRSMDDVDDTYGSDLPSVRCPYHELTKGDEALWELVQQNACFLEACPEDNLLHQW